MPERQSRPRAAQAVDLGTIQRGRGRRRAPSRSVRSGCTLAALGILLVAAAVVAVVLTVRARSTHSTGVPATSGVARIGVVFMLDGLSPQDLQIAGIPHIRALLAAGTSYSSAWIGQGEADAAVSSATVATGALPKRHGLIARQWADAGGLVVTPTDPGQVSTGSIDQVMENRGEQPLADLLKGRDAGARVLSVGGVGCAEASAAGTWLADYVACPVRVGNRWEAGAVAGHGLTGGGLRGPAWYRPVVNPPGLGAVVTGWRIGQEDRWIAGYTVAAMRRTHPRLTFVSFTEPAALAQYVPESGRSALMAQLVRGIDGEIGSIEAELKRERVLQKSVFVITSGQPVTPVSQTVSTAVIDEAILAGGGEKKYLEADKLALLGLHDPLQGQPVAQAVQAETVKTVDAIFYRVHRARVWSYLPSYLNPSLSSQYGNALEREADTMAESVSPDVIVVYRAGVAQQAPALPPYAVSGGSRGFEWDSQSIPLIISGRGVARRVRSRYPARLVDIAPTLAHVMNLGSLSADGVVLNDALATPNTDLAHAQAATGKLLAPEVAALRQRSSQ